MQPVVYSPPIAPPPLIVPQQPTVVEQPKIVYPENDFRFFQYSKLALPLLLFTLGIFVALLCLTMWQSRSDIRALRPGVPRTFQTIAQRSANKESGVPKSKRNVRIASFFIGVVFAVAAIIVYLTDMSPVLRARLNYPLGLLLILDSVLTWIAFALDVNSERQVVYCTSFPNETPVCQSREDLGTGCSVFDAFHALFLGLSGILVIFYTYTGDWCRESQSSDVLDADVLYQQTYKPNLLRNGVSTVRRAITMMSLVAAVVTGIILCIFTILVHEVRATYQYKDMYNRVTPYASGSGNTLPGWPLQNSKLRYASCSFIIVTILFNLIPLTSRVIAYMLGFLYFVYIVMTYATFGLDIQALNDARNTTCPQGLYCYYDSFQTCVVLDFMGATVLALYVIWEYFISKRPQKIANAGVA